MAAAIDHVKSLNLARAKLVEKRRALAKRDSISDRDEGFASLIITLHTALDATDHAIAEEERLKAEAPEETTEAVSAVTVSAASPSD